MKLSGSKLPKNNTEEKECSYINLYETLFFLDERVFKNNFKNIYGNIDFRKKYIYNFKRLLLEE